MTPALTLSRYRLVARLLAAIFLAVSFVALWQGPAPITGPWDVMALLDGAWRIVNGQIPHVDYHNPIGPLTYLATAFGMKIAGPSTLSIVVGSVLLLVVLLPWAWRIASSRLPPAMAFVTVFFAGFLLISPRPLGYGIRETTYAMLYNRQGYVLLSMFLVCLFLSRRESSKYAQMVDGFSAGLLLALMLYCKITYFAVAAASVLPGVVLFNRSKSWFFAALAGIMGASAAFYVFFHINLPSYLSDIAAAGHAQSPGMRIHLLKLGLTNNLLWIYLIFLWLGLGMRINKPLEKPPVSIARPWLITGWIVAIALVVETGNSVQGGGVEDPLFFIAGLIAIESFRRRQSEPMRNPANQARLVYAAAIMVVVPVFCGSILVRDLAAFSYSTAWNLAKRHSFEASRRLHSESLRDFLVPESTKHITEYWPARDHPAKINEGLDLLRKYLAKGDRVATIAYINPFSFALGLRPARGGEQWWGIDLSFDRRAHPSPESFLSDASLVMVPKRGAGPQGWGFETVDAMLELYGDYLRANFKAIASSDAWILYRRR
jgi:hypothetical protein